MQELQLFSSEFGNIRMMEIEGEPWFVGKDIAEALGYTNTRKALIDHVDDEDKNTVTIRDGNRGNPNVIFINESGMYALIFSSQLASARKFKRWVTSEVLPQIRKNGSYSKNINGNIQLLAQGHVQLQGEIDSLRAELNELKYNSMGLLASDARKIKSAVAAKVVETLGGTNSNAYKDNALMKQVFTNVYYTTNKAMGVRTYKHVRSNQVEEYIETVGEYTPSDRILKAINECNEQN